METQIGRLELLARFSIAVMQIITKHAFLLLLIFVLLVGLWQGDHLDVLVAHNWLKWWIVFSVMVAMTWPLKLEKIARVGSRPLPVVIASVLNLVAAPLIAWPISYWLGHDLGSGLIVATAVPSTLASAAVWTHRAGGNTSIAILTTVVTNLFCFVVTPTWVMVLARLDVAGIDLWDSIWKLLVFVVIPMVIGQLLRIHPVSADWADSNSGFLRRFAQAGMLAMVLMGAAKTGANFGASSSEPEGTMIGPILVTIVAVAAIHLFLLTVGIYLARAAHFPPADQIAVGFSASQKTLMVGLSTALNMGLNIIPLVAYHALQLIIDTIVADRFRAKSKIPDNHSQS